MSEAIRKAKQQIHHYAEAGIIPIRQWADVRLQQRPPNDPEFVFSDTSEPWPLTNVVGTWALQMRALAEDCLHNQRGISRADNFEEDVSDWLNRTKILLQRHKMADEIEEPLLTAFVRIEQEQHELVA